MGNNTLRIGTIFELKRDLVIEKLSHGCCGDLFQIPVLSLLILTERGGTGVI